MFVLVNIIFMKILLGEILYERNISYRQFEIMTKIPKSTIADICNGYTMPKIDAMEVMAKALNIRITDLFESDFK